MDLWKVLPLLFIVFVSGCTTQYNGTVTPQYSLESINYPPSVKAGEEFTISWKVNTNVPATIKHTAIHYSSESHPGDYGLDVTPASSGYSGLTTDYASGNFSIPNTFPVKVNAPTNSDKLYFRAHAIIEGKNYWTQEYTVNVERTTQTPSGGGVLQGEVTPPTSTTQEFSIEADDSAFYMSNQRISSISVTKGNTVKITFKVKEAGTYFGGLDFRGCGQDTQDTRPGSSVDVQFNAASTCTITSYWPASNVRKTDLQVVVS